MIAAVEYNSSTAWPGMICDKIYVSGNPFMVVPAWAINPELYKGKFSSLYRISSSSSYEHIRYITGGEPFHHYIEEFINKLHRTIHCPIRIDTDGAYPFRLKTLLETDQVSHVGLRLWYPSQRYKLHKAFPVEAIQESLKIVQQFPSSEIVIPYDPNYTMIETIEEALDWNDNVVVKVLNSNSARVGTVYGKNNSYILADEIAKLTAIVESLANKTQTIEVI